MPNKRSGRRRAACLLMLACLGLPPIVTQARPLDDSPRLSDWWRQQGQLPVPGARPYFLRKTDLPTQHRLGRRLLAELSTLIGRASLARDPASLDGLVAWRDAIDRELDRGGRTPARADLAALLAAPRHDPALDGIAAVGVCRPPDWIEIWTRSDVIRVPWHPGSGLQEAMADLSPSQRGEAQAAWLISPQGPPSRLGIAAWNAQEAELVPGSRVVLERGETLPAAAWINRRLPRFLASRLPGIDCHRLATAPTVSQRNTTT